MQYKTQQGITLIEVVVAVAIAGMLIGGIATLATISVRVTAQASDLVLAISLAQEGVEAVRSIRDEMEWENGIGSLEPGQEYYATLLSNPPAMELLKGTEVIGKFTRSIVFERVYRDGNNEIAETGEEDNNTRRVVVRVLWQERNGEREETLVTYVTNWR